MGEDVRYILTRAPEPSMSTQPVTVKMLIIIFIAFTDTWVSFERESSISILNKFTGIIDLTLY